MKRFAKRFCLFLVPFVVVVLLFFMFEPYDYFLLRGDAAYDTMPLSSMRRVAAEKPANIILGDSKMANLNTDYIREITGESYQMLGFGGANIGECIELFWFAAAHTDLEKVYFGLSFYMMRGQYNTGRVPEIKTRAANVFRFVSDFTYWLQAINEAKQDALRLLGRPVEPPEDPTKFDPVELPTAMGERYRLDLEQYALEKIYPSFKDVGENYLDAKTFEELDKIIAYCDENGIELTFVFTPTHESLYTLVLEPLGYGGVTQTVKDYVIGRARVLDMEFQNDFTAADSNFFDGFHLTGPNKKWMTELLFTDTASGYIVRFEKGAGTAQAGEEV